MSCTDSEQTSSSCSQHADSPGVGQFAGLLQGKHLQTTSTPILKKSISLPKLDLGSQHDSGFSELSLLLNSQSSEKHSDLSSKEDNIQSQQPVTSADDRRQEPGNKFHTGLEKMQAYFDTMNRICPKHLRIGYRMGKETVDIISCLNKLQIPALDAILRFLDDADLARCVEVSSRWRSIFNMNQNVQERFANMQSEKENQSSPKVDESSRAFAVTSPLSSIQVDDNISPTHPTSPEGVSTGSAMLDRFTKAARQLKVGEQFVKCPRCQGPAKLYREARQGLCVTRSCKYNYCTICELVFHGSKDCAIQLSKKTKNRDQPINSKQSKRHLKRL